MGGIKSNTCVDYSDPLTPTLSSGSFREFVENERVFVNPVLRWKLSEQTQANFWVQYTHTDDSVDPGIPQLGNRPAPIPRERNLTGSAPFEIDSTRVGFDWSHAFNDRWTVRHTFEAVLDQQAFRPTFAVLGPDPARCSAQDCPVDLFFLTPSLHDTESYYTALNLTGKLDTWGLTHTLLLGGDYWHQQNSDFRSAAPPPSAAPPIDLFNPVHTGVPAFETLDEFQSADKIEEWYGFYVQDQVKLPFNVHVLAGFRYDDARHSEIYTDAPGGPSSGNPSADSAVTPRFGLLWQPIPAVNLYGNYVENFGGANLFSRTASGTAPPAETAQQWEIGAKTDFFDGRLSATLAWFDITKQNIANADPNPARALAGFSVVTGEARNRGLELNVSGEIWPDVRAIASYAYIDSEITKARQAIFNDDFTEVIGFNAGNQGHRLCRAIAGVSG